MSAKWKERHCLGTVLYDFTPNGTFQIPLKQGEKVEVLKESSGWYKGHCVDRPQDSGIFPVTFVKLHEDQALPDDAATRAKDIKSSQPPPPMRAKVSTGSGAYPPASPSSPSASVAAAAAAAAPAPAAPTTSSSTSPSSTGSMSPSSSPKPVAVTGSMAAGKPAATAANASASASASSSASSSAAASVTASSLSSGKFPAASSPTNASALSSMGRSEKNLPRESGNNGQGGLLAAVGNGSPQSRLAGAPFLGEFEMKPSARSLKSLDMTAEALFGEMDHSVKEWSALLKTHLESGNEGGYHQIKERMAALLELRRKAMDPAQEGNRDHVKRQIVQLMESSRRSLEGFMVPRNNNGEAADSTNTGLIELLDLHRVMYKTLNDEAAKMFNFKTLTRQDTTKNVNAVVQPAPTGDLEWPSGPLQLFMDVKMCIFSVGEPTELYFSLYSKEKDTFITEPYPLILTAAGMPEDLKLLGKMTTIFKDLEARDFQSELYLVCRIYRKGRIVFDPKNHKPPSRTYRRPFGCACTCLSNVGLEGLIGKEYQPPNVAMTIFMPSNEAQFHKIHELIIQNDKTLEPAPRAKGMALGFVLYKGDIDQVRALDKKLNPAEVPVTNKLKFPEVMNPGDIRNDFYCYLRSGHFLQDKKKSAKNIEVIVQVLNDKGQAVENCILRGSSDSDPLSEYRTAVYYHLNSPSWDERIRLKIDPAIFERCHLFFSFWHASTNQTNKKSSPFGFAFLRISTDSGAVIPDETYSIPTYKPFPKIEEVGAFTPWYLGIGDAPGGEKLTARKESMFVSTILCSTKKTQNPVLHSLFKWRNLPDQDTLLSYLSKFTEIPFDTFANEIVKFIRETFDVFLAILNSPQHEPLLDAVFSALLYMVDQLSDHNKSFVESYISTIFNDAVVHRTLTRLCTAALKDAQTNPTENSKRLCKGLDSQIKMMVSSRRFDAQLAQPSCDGPTFNKRLSEMMQAVNALVKEDDKDKNKEKEKEKDKEKEKEKEKEKTGGGGGGDNKDKDKEKEKTGGGGGGGDNKDKEKEDTMTRNRAQCRSSLIAGFHGYINNFKGVFTESELGVMCTSFIKAVPNWESLTVAKLTLIYNILGSTTLADHKDGRKHLFPVVIQVLKQQLSTLDKAQSAVATAHVCMLVMRKMLSIAQFHTLPPEDLQNFTELLEPVVQLVILIQTPRSSLDNSRDFTHSGLPKIEPVPDSATILWTLITVLTDKQITAVFESMSKPALRNFLISVLDCCTAALELKVYPEMWVIMTMFQVQQIRRTSTLLSTHIKQHFRVANNFDDGLWRRYFKLNFELLTGEMLQIENFSEKKRKFVDDRYGDLRKTAAEELTQMWHSLGSRHKITFIESLVLHLFELFVRPVPELQKFALEIYFDMMCQEWQETKELVQVERHAVDALYQKANLSQELGQKFISYVYNELKVKLETKPAMVTAGTAFLNHLQRMSELMNSLLQFPDTALYEDERTSVALKLLGYLQSTMHSTRKEMYTRYVQFLVNLHAGLKNFVEAGLTQLLQINMLEWTDTDMGKERERDLKERLYKSAISYFTQGDDYERAIERCAELCDYYQYDSYEYDKLSQVLLQQSKYFSEIATTERFYCNYFRVVFYGKGFSEDIRKPKEFVYRGVKLEPVMDFTNRMKRKYPDARILMSSEAPKEEELAAKDQIISITTLTKPPEDVRERLLASLSADKKKITSSVGPTERRKETAVRNKNFPPAIAKYRDANNLRVFEYSKGLQKSKEEKPENEFKDLWVVRTYVFLEDSFPTLRRRLEIVDRKEEHLSPVENALATMRGKNEELKEKIEHVRRAVAAQAPVDMGPLSMNLNGIIDAAVNGGTKKYVEAFLTAEYLTLNPDPESRANQAFLKAALKDQIDILQDGLALFSFHCDEKLQGLATHLATFYGQMKTTMLPIIAAN